jgi:hypothetical protein
MRPMNTDNFFNGLSVVIRPIRVIRVEVCAILYDSALPLGSTTIGAGFIDVGVDGRC